MRLEVDGRQLRSMHDFHDLIAGLDGVPEFYGRNLDALSDVLTGYIDEPVEIIFRKTSAARETLGTEFSRLVLALQDIVVETADTDHAFTFRLAD